MSQPEQEARALELAREFLLALSSGRHPARPIRDLRAEARDIAKHYPANVRDRWLSEVSRNRCHFAMSPNVDIAETYTNADKSGPDVHKHRRQHEHIRQLGSHK